MEDVRSTDSYDLPYDAKKSITVRSVFFAAAIATITKKLDGGFDGDPIARSGNDANRKCFLQQGQRGIDVTQ